MLGASKIKITLRTDELPDWSRNGKLGVDLLFDDNSYDEMQQALRQAIALNEKKEEGKLVEGPHRLTGTRIRKIYFSCCFPHAECFHSRKR